MMSLQATVTRTSRTPGRARSSVNTIAQGMPVIAARPVVTEARVVLFFPTRGYGCGSAPGIPCALASRGSKLCSNPGAGRAAGTAVRLLCPLTIEIIKQARSLRLRRLSGAPALVFAHPKSVLLLHCNLRENDAMLQERALKRAKAGTGT